MSVVNCPNPLTRRREYLRSPIARKVGGPLKAMSFLMSTQPGDAIPDSAVYRWTHSEGSGTTLGDSIGNNDGSITGSTWESVADAQDGQELSHDGDDDSVSFSTVSEIGTGQDFAIGITLQPDNFTQTAIVFEHSTGSSDRVHAGIDGSDFFATTYDGSGNTDPTDTGGNATTDRQRFLINYNLSSSDITIFRDTTDVSSSMTPGGITAGSADFRLASNTGGSRHFSGDTDDLVVYSSVLSSDEVQSDYDAQPWT